MLKGGGYEKSALQTPFPELHAQKKSRLICLTIGRVDRTMFLKGTIVTNQAAHGMVTHQAAPRHDFQLYGVASLWRKCVNGEKTWCGDPRTEQNRKGLADSNVHKTLLLPAGFLGLRNI